MSFRLATWNVNSLKVRLPQVLDWLAAQQPDILCLQETKQTDAAFPFAALEDAGYVAYSNGQKTYNGVAIIARTPAQALVHEIPDFSDPQRRVLALTLNGLRVICAYFPNGQALGSEKFTYKLHWLEALTAWLAQELAKHPRLILAGDFNIAPAAEDVHPQWDDEIHVSFPERAAFTRLLDLGLVDAFRCFPQAEARFSWWDYRRAAFRRNLGLRIDHILISEALRPHAQACLIDTAPRALERPSDHAPVLLTLDL
ncbi:exodeoxyribonuclease III [Thiorhodospira sibirica]|uniref:exodeoxyribonuclease III n=1 Tax=Thiorhodospira sibirica TaxID=154347 RepID=UPI00022C0467|nr:exodeoxyribonuclease III [Thiorhodospira sibirica]